MPPFISCVACGCAAKSFETTCPHCGEALRTQIGVPRTAAALLLGLVTVAGSAAIGGCGDSTSDSGGGSAGGADAGGSTGDGGAAPEYGVPATGGMPAQGGAAEGGAAEGGSTGEGGFAAEYGVPGTGGGGGAP
jgi:hypothetical protein